MNNDSNSLQHAFDAATRAVKAGPLPLADPDAYLRQADAHYQSGMHGVPPKPTPEPECPACVQSGCQCLGCGLVEHGMPAGQEPLKECPYCGEGPWYSIDQASHFKCRTQLHTDGRTIRQGDTCKVRVELNAARAKLLAPESDSPVAACDCLTKTPDIQFHRAGCRYRLIEERNSARAQLTAAQVEARELGELIGLASTSFSMLEAYLGPQWFEAVASLDLVGPDKIHARAALDKHQPQTTLTSVNQAERQVQRAIDRVEDVIDSIPELNQ